MISHVFLRKRTICDLAGELMQETLPEFEGEEIEARAREMRPAKKKSKEPTSAESPTKIKDKEGNPESAVGSR